MRKNFTNLTPPLKLLAYKNTPLHFHSLIASTSLQADKDDRFHFVFRVIFVSFSPP